MEDVRFVMGAGKVVKDWNRSAAVLPDGAAGCAKAPPTGQPTRAGAGCVRAHGASRADGPPHPPHLH